MRQPAPARQFRSSRLHWLSRLPFPKLRQSRCRLSPPRTRVRREARSSLRDGQRVRGRSSLSTMYKADCRKDPAAGPMSRRTRSPPLARVVPRLVLSLQSQARARPSSQRREVSCESSPPARATLPMSQDVAHTRDLRRCSFRVGPESIRPAGCSRSGRSSPSPEENHPWRIGSWGRLVVIAEDVGDSEPGSFHQAAQIVALEQSHALDELATGSSNTDALGDEAPVIGDLPPLFHDLTADLRLVIRYERIAKLVRVEKIEHERSSRTRHPRHFTDHLQMAFIVREIAEAREEIYDQLEGSPLERKHTHVASHKLRVTRLVDGEP